MPGDVMVNFYINLSKLCLTVYQLHVLPPNTTKVSSPVHHPPHPLPQRCFIKSQCCHVTRSFALRFESFFLLLRLRFRTSSPPATRSCTTPEPCCKYSVCSLCTWRRNVVLMWPRCLVVGSELNNNRFEVSHVHKVECVVPWLNDTLVFFTISLQLCQQLKDKVG